MNYCTHVLISAFHLQAHVYSVKLAGLSSVNHIPDLDHMEIVDDICVLCL